MSWDMEDHMMLMERLDSWEDRNDTQHLDHWHSGQSWVNQQWPTAHHHEQSGQWMFCKDWCDCPHYVNGWVYVQGFFQWGVALTWHVQRSAFTDPGSLFWVCMLWRKDDAGIWNISLQKQEKIAFDDQSRYPEWQIHEPAGGAAHA